MFRTSSIKVLKRLAATSKPRNFSSLPETNIGSESTSELALLKKELAKTQTELQELTKVTQQHETANNFVRSVVLSIGVSMLTKEYLERRDIKKRDKIKKATESSDTFTQFDHISSPRKFVP